MIAVALPPAGASSASGPADALGLAARKKSGEDAMAAFLDYARMTPAQRMRANILAGMGMSEADLRAMDPKKRALIEKEIEQRIRWQVQEGAEKKTGVLADLKA